MPCQPISGLSSQLMPFLGVSWITNKWGGGGGATNVNENSLALDSCTGCRNRMQGWESVRWLVIGITLSGNRKVGSFLSKIDSCFLIEAKFISKLFKKFRRQNESQEIPRLRLFMIFKNSSFLIFKNSGILNFKNSQSGNIISN